MFSNSSQNLLSVRPFPPLHFFLSFLPSFLPFTAKPFLLPFCLPSFLPSLLPSFLPPFLPSFLPSLSTAGTPIGPSSPSSSVPCTDSYASTFDSTFATPPPPHTHSVTLGVSVVLRLLHLRVWSSIAVMTSRSFRCFAHWGLGHRPTDGPGTGARCVLS